MIRKTLEQEFAVEYFSVRSYLTQQGVIDDEIIEFGIISSEPLALPVRFVPDSSGSFVIIDRNFISPLNMGEHGEYIVRQFKHKFENNVISISCLINEKNNYLYCAFFRNNQDSFFLHNYDDNLEILETNDQNLEKISKYHKLDFQEF